MKILLMGNPNVGKSVVFSRLTGVNVTVSNYPGTTVELAKGWTQYNGERVEVIDAPGVYSLDASSKSEEVAVDMLKECDLIINVVDSTKLERNLNLTLQLIETGLPICVALNIWDETKHKGIQIDVGKLEKLLGVPVVCTAAIAGMGIKDLFFRLREAAPREAVKRTQHERWDEIGKIISSAQSLFHHHHTLMEALEEASVRPVSGILIATTILFASFKIIRFIAEGLINFIFEPFFNKFYMILVAKLSLFLGEGGLLHDILIGRLIEGRIDFIQSFGLLTSGIFFYIAMVLTYLFSFYFVLGILEDSGYLPRLAILLDTIMHRIGLHGYAIIPNLLSLGCNVPGILSTRILESKRERFIASALISIGVPCASLQAMIFGILGKFGARYVFIVYLTLFCVWLILGFVLNRILKGFSPPLLIEVPNYRMPPIKMMLNKLWFRIVGFLKEGLPILMFGILIVNILYFLRLFDIIADFFSPMIKGTLGLPKEAVVAILIGFLRKDVAVGMLAALGLTVNQLVIGCVVLSMFFPCIATFVILLKELGLKDMLKITGIMIFSSLLVGGLLNLIL